MKLISQLYIAAGRTAYIALRPGLALYRSTRTRGLIFDETGQILLVKGWLSDGRWSLPGGGKHRHESLADCISRETREETGLAIPASDWRHVTNRQINATSYVYFSCQIKNAAPTARPYEIIDAQWFDPSDLPKYRTKSINILLNLA